MSHARFYVEQLTEGLVELPKEESSHAAASRRLAVGETVMLTDGMGREALGHIVAVDRRRMQVDADPPVTRPRPYPTWALATAIPKGPRQDVLIEKCAELGMASLWPLKTERSIVHPKEHSLVKWRRRAIEAMKQSGQCHLPEIREPMPLDTAVRSADPTTYDLRLVANSQGDSEAESYLAGKELVTRLHGARQVIVFIGPEGGWSPSELEAFMQAHATPISLGPNILRIETAAMAIGSLIHSINRPQSE